MRCDAMRADIRWRAQLLSLELPPRAAHSERASSSPPFPHFSPVFSSARRFVPRAPLSPLFSFCHTVFSLASASPVPLPLTRRATLPQSDSTAASARADFFAKISCVVREKFLRPASLIPTAAADSASASASAGSAHGAPRLVSALLSAPLVRSNCRPASYSLFLRAAPLLSSAQLAVAVVSQSQAPFN